MFTPVLFVCFQVRELVGRCTCPRQFPIIKVGEGKYKIGDNQTLVFVRVSNKNKACVYFDTKHKQASSWS